MRKPILAYIPALARHQGVNAAHPINQILTVRRTSEATRINKDGLVEQVSPELPRQDWEGSNCPSLLLEPERTNLVLKSEDFTDTGNASTGWDSSAFGSGTITVTNSHPSPSGELSAYKMEIDGVASGNNGCLFTHDDYNGTRFADAGDYTVSVWMKGEKGGEIVPLAFRSRTSSGADFGDAVLTTEWVRYTFTYTKGTASSTSGGFQFRFYNRTDIDKQSFYIWGAQIEKAGYASSYIKTEGSTETRTKDYATGWSGSWISDADLSEGSFFVDATHFEDPLNAYCQITLSDGGSNFIRNIYENGRVRTTAWNGTSQFDYFDTGADEDQRNKILFTFKENEFKLYRAGQLITTDSSGAVPTGLSRLDLSDQYGSGRFFEGKIHDIRVFDYVLSEAEAIKLTS
jgi:hypothetical protein